VYPSGRVRLENGVTGRYGSRGRALRVPPRRTRPGEHAPEQLARGTLARPLAGIIHGPCSAGAESRLGTRGTICQTEHRMLRPLPYGRDEFGDPGDRGFAAAERVEIEAALFRDRARQRGARRLGAPTGSPGLLPVAERLGARRSTSRLGPARTRGDAPLDESDGLPQVRLVDDPAAESLGEVGPVLHPEDN
jgi:hypothetical protein